ncbi:uncharacterized protein LOC143300511 isoform X2 [Babylonia areolata]
MVVCLQASLFAAIVMSPATHSDTKCSASVPRNCTFQNNSCGWNMHNWELKPDGSKVYKYARLKFSRKSGYLESKCVIVNTPISHCLHFRYLADSETYGLTVKLSWPHNDSEQQLWHSSQNQQWTNVSVSVESDSNFTLIITGSREKKEKTKTVYIDDIVYDKKACPGNRATTTVSSKETLTSVLTTETSVSASRTHSIASTERHAAGFTSPATTTTSTVTTTATSPRTTPEKQGAADSSAAAGTIVGAILAVIFVSVIVLVFLIIFFRRNHFMCWKMRSEENRTDLKAGLGSGEDYDTLTDVSRDENYTEINISDVTQSDRCTPVSEAGTSRMSVENYSAIRDVHQDESSLAFQHRPSLYCQAQATLQATLTTAGQALDSPYEISADNPVAPHQGGAQSDDYSKMCFDGRGAVDREHTDSHHSPYDHVHTTDKADGETQEALYEMIKDSISEASHQQRQEWLPHDTHAERIPQNPDANAPGVYHIIEQMAATQGADKESTDTCRIDEDTTIKNPESHSTGAYHNLENSASQKSGTEITMQFHVVEDSPSPKPGENTHSVYHVLEEHPTQTPQTTTTDHHQPLEETFPEGDAPFDLRDIIPTSSESPMSESSPLPREEATDYNHLQFDGSEPVENVTGGEGGEGGGDVYSHVKEGGENTYDEVDRDRQSDVIDDDYSRIW